MSDQTEIQRLTAERDEARERIAQLHPRVWKLVDKGRAFIVIGDHEPYYIAAYDMIRKHEIEKGTWTDEDQIAFASEKARCNFGGSYVDSDQ